MAASARITYNPGSLVGGAHVANAARYTLLAQQEIDRAVAIAASITAFGVTPTNIEGSTEFGVASGQGATFYSAITSLQSSLNAITGASLANLDQG